MLARASSDAGTRLRRSKSTSTVHRPPPHALEPLDPDVAQQHAVAAATAAYTRACKTAEADRTQKRSFELSRAKSTSSRKSLGSQGSHFPPRESSVRPIQCHNGENTSSGQGQSRAPTTEKFPSFCPTPGSDGPFSVHSSTVPNENLRPNSQSKPNQQSASSSVTSQQIRKARSMYYASSVQTGSPIPRPPAKYLITPPLTESPAPHPSPALLQVRTAPRSPLASPQLPVTVDPGETIDKARDRYLQDFQQRQVKHKPSLFLAPFKKRQELCKKKDRPMSAGVLSVSSGSMRPQLGAMVESLDDFGMPKQKREKRSLSNSIREKFRKVFKRTSNNSTTLPVQQIEASRNYFSYPTIPTAQLVALDTGLGIPSPDDETLLRVRSRTPTIERAPSPLARPISRSSNRSRGSSRSLHSEITYPSTRVTSWNDSSAGGTLTQRDIKRLTVIHEAKDSISSEADRNDGPAAKRKSAMLSGFAAFKDPLLMPMESLSEEGSTPVDPKRVFSALMKEIDKSTSLPAFSSALNPSPGTESDVFESSATKELHYAPGRHSHSSEQKHLDHGGPHDRSSPSHQQPNNSQSKASSLMSLGRALKSTIRTVTPTRHKGHRASDDTASIRGAVRIPRPSTASSSDSTSRQSQRDDEDKLTFLRTRVQHL